MTNEQWQKLLDVLDGKTFDPPAVGFIIDSPWLPSWAGMSIMDYFANEQMWFEANLKAQQQFGDVMFLPGFWSEFGMCTDTSPFGVRCIWSENDFPHADKVIGDVEQIDKLIKPNPKTDGLCPFVIKRLKHYQPKIEEAGHSIKFAVSRGPLNIAAFLMGTTEFIMATQTDRGRAGRLLDIITEFIVDWLRLQVETFDSIDGVLILDDIVGFFGEDDFKRIALGRLKRIYDSCEVSVKFFHNDADGLVCAPYLPRIGINLFNFSFNHSIAEMRELTNNSVTLLGNIPPREGLADAATGEVADGVAALLDSAGDTSRLILSCGGGMPPGVSTENIEAFMSAAGY